MNESAVMWRNRFDDPEVDGLYLCYVRSKNGYVINRYENGKWGYLSCRFDYWTELPQAPAEED